MVWQCSLVVAAAILGAEALTLLFYSIFFSDRLYLDLLLTAIIVLIVAYPLAYIFLTQSVRLLHLTEAIERASRIDDLSQLLNRKSFLAETDALLTRCSTGSAGTFLYLDIDHFKLINDEMGHAVGDEVIRRMGLALQPWAGKGNVVGRLGGEEFAIFMPGGDPGDAQVLYRHIALKAKDIGQELGLGSQHVCLSAGVASHQSGQSLSALMKLADENLYKAKSGGRNRLESGYPGIAA
ncbi:GGDEF domain-containing protein [Chelativorans alearense]|uniref:GGDEF domain-containing protein n=1 Tax=Chelativorans alearense TaxID=2681495 RepID=UPI0013D37C43|nr:GGDEF domain-containing protein [Chelativorans alearense]